MNLALFIISCLLILQTHSFSDVHVQRHVKKDGTDVKEHWKSDPNETDLDNWSTKGNENPHTGKPGTKQPKKNPH